MPEDHAPPQIIDGLAVRCQTYRGIVARCAGQGEPLILFHGGRGSWNHWVRNIGPLSARYSVFALDLPGFGESVVVERTLPVDAYIDILGEGVAAIAGNGPVLFAAFSFGAMVAAGLAARLGSQVRKLSLLAPSGWGNDRAVGESRYKSLRGTRTEEERRAVHRHNLGVAHLADPASLTEEAVSLQIYNITHSTYDSAKAGSEPCLFDYLALCHGPIQVIMGTRDIIQAPSVDARMASLAERFPRIRFDRIDGAAHWTQYDKPAAYNRALLAFLESSP
ncbi:MAG: alpha/beta fold hydrolase [Alphaproteobacteria bacterium]